MRNILFVVSLFASSFALACKDFSGTYKNSDDPSRILKVEQRACEELKLTRSNQTNNSSELEVITVGNGYYWGAGADDNKLIFSYRTNDGHKVSGTWILWPNGGVSKNTSVESPHGTGSRSYQESWEPISN